MAVLTQDTFERIARIAYDRWGLHITEKKRELVTARLTKYLRKRESQDASAYLDHLESDADGEELLEFFDMLSTNVTSFFREPAHFDYLASEFYSNLASGRRKRVRIWSAACSTGQEPYSLVINALESFPEIAEWDFKVLATDLSNTAVAEANRGVYPDSAVSSIPREVLGRYFQRGKGASSGLVRINEFVRSFVTIRRLNLHEAWAFSGPFDVIFCRNVMIYFDDHIKQQLVSRMYDILSEGGILAIGSAETLTKLSTPFRTVSPSVYMK